MSLERLGVCEIRGLYERKEASPVDVVEALLAAQQSRDGDIHAFLELYADDALAHARRMRDSGSHRRQPLGGVPIAIKDNICIEGRPTTCASRILEGYSSLYTAGVIDRLRAAGAIILGKTNLDEFAMGSSTENSAMGVTRNPWDTARTPGGSSGGSAAAVAANFAPAALGSDTGGSIRQPASFCGVVGMKPTYGRVSRYGLLAFASSLDQIGPLTRSVADAAVVLDAISGHDPRDSTSLSLPAPDSSALLEGGLKGLTIGVPWSFLGDAMDADARENFSDTVRRSEDAGATIIEIDLPHAEYGVAAYYIIANAEASANLARFDGVKDGHRAKDPGDLYEMYTRTRDEGFGEEVKRRILLGTYVLSAGYYDAYYLKAQQVRSLIIRDFETVYKTCDLIMLPTSPGGAFAVGERMEDPIAMYLSDFFTIPVNLAGQPAISVPSGLTDGGLPLGVQLIGKALDESMVLRGAAGIERTVAFEGLAT